MKRWKILHVSHLFSAAFISHPLRGNGKKHTGTFEMGPAALMETRNGTSDDFTNLILTGGPTGVTGDSSPSPPADQYVESGHYAAFSFFFSLSWNACTIDMLLFFICWLYLIPSLLFPLPEQRKPLPPLKHESYFYFCWGVRTSLNSCQAKCPWLFVLFFFLQSVRLLSLFVLKSWWIIAWWSLYRLSMSCTLLFLLLFPFFPPSVALGKACFLSLTDASDQRLNEEMRFDASGLFSKRRIYNVLLNSKKRTRLLAWSNGTRCLMYAVAAAAETAHVAHAASKNVWRELSPVLILI